MRHITRNTEPFNSTPLFQAARDREFRAMSYAEHRMVDRYGVDPHAESDADVLDEMGTSEYWPVPIRGIEQ